MKPDEAARSTPETSSMPPITRESVSQKAYLLIRRSLMTSQFVPGQKLILRSLAADLQISLTPLREALFKLVTENLLIVDARGTVRIPEMTLDRYVELRDLRVLVEGEGAARAARRVGPRELAGLVEIQERLERALDQSRYKRALQINERFHFDLCRCGGSEVMLRIVENLWLQCGPLLGRLYDKGHDVSVEHPHRKVLQALAAHDAEAARALIGEDIVRGGGPLLDVLRTIAPAHDPDD